VQRANSLPCRPLLTVTASAPESRVAAASSAAMAPAQHAPPDAEPEEAGEAGVDKPRLLQAAARDVGHLSFMLSHDKAAAKTEVTLAALEAALAATTSDRELVVTLHRCCLAGATRALHALLAVQHSTLLLPLVCVSHGCFLRSVCLFVRSTLLHMESRASPVP
jgi:hypothetical protein